MITTSKAKAAWTKGRAPAGGADWLIVQAIEAGHSSLLAIADYARVEPAAAREALNRLRRSGQVRRYGATKSARYVRIHRRQRCSSRA